VQALVFIAGWMPDEGESIQQLLESKVFGDSLVPAALRPVPFTDADGSEVVDLYLDREFFPEAFAADVDPDTAAVIAVTQRPWSGAAAATPSGPARVAFNPVVVPARHRGSRHSACGTALHGQAWERANGGGGGLACVHGVAARGRDAADPERRRRDEPQPGVTV